MRSIVGLALVCILTAWTGPNAGLAAQAGATAATPADSGPTLESPIAGSLGSDSAAGYAPDPAPAGTAGVPADTTCADTRDAATPADSVELSVAAGGQTVPAADSVPPAAGTDESAAAAAPPILFSGYFTGSYNYSTRDAGDQIVGHFYDRFNNEFMANAAKLVAEVPVATERLSAGVRVDAIVGQNATVLKSAGLDLGEQADLTQAFLTLNLPAGADRYVQFKAGKMVTLLGYEVIEDVANPNLSVANQFVYLENLTNTGIGVDLKLSPVWDAQLRLINGWDNVRDNNSSKSVMGRLGLTPSDHTTIGLVGYFGPEQEENGSNQRYGGQLLASQKLASAVTAVAQLDYGEEEFDGGKANWFGIGAWVVVDLSPRLGLALRGDYVDDRDGARTSEVLGFPANAGQTFGSATATLNVKVWDKVLIRPELRYDRSDLEAFDGDRDQLTAGLGLSYIFP